VSWVGISTVTEKPLDHEGLFIPVLLSGQSQGSSGHCRSCPAQSMICRSVRCCSFRSLNVSACLVSWRLQVSQAGCIGEPPENEFNGADVDSMESDCQGKS